MLANVAFVLLAGLVTLGTSALFALIGSDLSIPLLVLSFMFGAFLAWAAINRHGSAAVVWQKLRHPPG